MQADEQYDLDRWRLIKCAELLLDLANQKNCREFFDDFVQGEINAKAKEFAGRCSHFPGIGKAPWKLDHGDEELFLYVIAPKAKSQYLAIAEWSYHEDKHDHFYRPTSYRPTRKYVFAPTQRLETAKSAFVTAICVPY